MFNARGSALERLLAKFDEDEGEMIKKHSPKVAAVEVEAKPEPEASELPPELVAKLLEVLKEAKPEASEESVGEPLKLAHGGEVKADEPTGMGNHKCRGCGRDASMCVCDKMSEGGLIDGDSLHDEQMKRREEVRKLEQDRDASRDMAELAGEEPKVKVASRKKYSEGGLIEGDGLNDEQMKRREENRKLEQDQNAADDMDELSGEGKAKSRWKANEYRKSRHYRG